MGQILFADDREEELRRVTHSFSIGGHEAWLTIGFDSLGNVKEVALVLGRVGSLVSGLTEAVSTMVTLALQNGIPLRDIIAKLKGMRFEPSGTVTNRHEMGPISVAVEPIIPTAKSVLDYVARWLEMWDSSRDQSRKNILTPEGEMRLELQADQEALKTLREPGPGLLDVEEDRHLYG